MSIQQDAPNLRILAAGVVAQYALVTALGAPCGVSTTRTHIGTAQNPTTTAGDRLDVRMPHAGTAKMVASVAIAANAVVYYAANGQVGLTSASNTPVGIALTAASGPGSVLEVLPF